MKLINCNGIDASIVTNEKGETDATDVTDEADLPFVNISLGGRGQCYR